MDCQINFCFLYTFMLYYLQQESIILRSEKHFNLLNWLEFKTNQLKNNKVIGYLYFSRF